MSQPPDLSAETAKTLVAAATVVFAEQGYQHARVRDIVRRAGANVAAISYHFGGKEGLYLEVLRQVARGIVERYPLLHSGHKGSPEQQLREIIESLLGRFFSQNENSIAPRLLLRELTHPGIGLERMLQDFTGPQFVVVSDVVARLLGPGAAPDEVRCASLSVFGQCFVYLVARPMISRLAPQTYEADALAPLAAHLVAFTLAGLRDLRMRIEERSHA